MIACTLGYDLPEHLDALLGGPVHPDEVEPYPDEFFDLTPALPTEVNYEDNGEAHDDLARSTEGRLHRALFFGPRNGGVNWEEVEVREHETPLVVHCGQDFVMPHVVEHYIRGGGLAFDSGSCISLVTCAGITFPAIGTHRMAAVLAQAQTTFTGRWVVIHQDGTWEEKR